VRIITNTCNRPDVLRNKLWDKLVAQPKAASSPISQRITLSGIKAIWAQMKNLSEHPASTGTLKVIRSKFPDRTREKVGELRKKGEPSWTVDDLLQALDIVVEQLELMEDTDPRDNSSSVAMLSQRQYSSHRSPSAHSPSRRSNRNTSTHSSKRDYRNSEGTRCNFCLRRGHKAEECRELTTPRERRQACIDFSLCWKCLGTGHRSFTCGAPRCYICDRNHHSLLCYREPNASRDLARYRAYHQPRGPSRRDFPLRSSRPSRSRESSRDRSRASSISGASVSRSPSRDFQSRRRNSPYPRPTVGFTNPPTQSNTSSHTSTCITPFVESTTSDEDHESDGEDSIYSKISTQISLFCMSPSSHSSPRLMVAIALTYNFKEKTEQPLLVLLDSGSQYSYVRKSTASNLGLILKNPQNITALTFGGHKHTETSYEVNITLLDHANEPINLKLLTRDFITTIPSSNITYTHDAPNVFRSLENADVDVLIGIDHYWNIVNKDNNEQLPSGYVLSYTRFGPVISGLPADASAYSSNVNSAMASKKTKGNETEPGKTDEIVRKLFGLESVGMEEELNDMDKNVIEQYYSSVRVIDGCIHVKFPWKSGHPFLHDNKALAMRRLESQYAKLHSDQKGWSEYCQTFEQQLASGIIEDVTDIPPTGLNVYYIPHQGVRKDDSNTTKLRIVFDASSHMRDSPSLNDCIHQGPTLMPDLCGTLLRARFHPYLLIADV
ncbi:zinc knuckle, partial [Oesophagostomum dentatum]